MNIQTDYSLEDLATETIRLGRELTEAARAVSLGGSTHDAGFVTRSLRRVGERAPFDPRDEGSLEALRSIINADLKSEIQGIERRFVETHYDDHGQHGEVRDCAVYSERGDAILSVQETLIRFMKLRAATLDRIAAERALRTLLTG